MPSVKNPPWAPQSLVPLVSGSLALHVKRGGKPGFKKSLTAAATKVNATPSAGADRIVRGYQSFTTARPWQEEVLAAALMIGELRYIANTTANATSRAWVFPADAKDKADSTIKRKPYAAVDNAPEEEGAPPGAIDPEIIRRAALLLVYVGECYAVDLPRKAGRPATNQPDRETHIIAPMDLHFEADDYIRIGGTENSGRVSGGLRYPLKGVGAAKVTRIHRPDARNAQEPDSPARSALPVMRELMGLSMHVSATIDSRLAGGGVLGFPSDAEIARPTGQPQEMSFADALNEATTESISNRDQASAVAPILLGIPPGQDGTIKDKLVWLISPASTLDQNVSQLRDDNIRRIALGMDAPPEVILGAKGLSHFGAWSVEGEFIRLQIAPLLKLIADAFSVAYDVVYTFDTSPLTVRPNRAVEAQALYDRGVLSDSSLRAACGFTEEDAPEKGYESDAALDLALLMCRNSPSLLQTPGLPAIVDQCRIVLGQEPKYQEYYPGAEKAPLAGHWNQADQGVKADPSGATNGRGSPTNSAPGSKPSGNRPVSDGSPEGGADGKPHAVPSTN